MTLVLEGHDLTGKSSLARNLQWPQPRKSIKRGIKATIKSTLGLPPGYNTWVRCWLTESVYGKILRKTEGFHDGDLWRIGLHYESVGAVMLHMALTNDEIEERFAARGDPELNIEQIKKVALEYFTQITLFEKFLPPVFTNNLVGALFAHHLRQQRYATLHALGDSAWGSLNPRLLLIVQDETEATPFNAAGSAHGSHIFQMLSSAGLGPKDVRIVSNYMIKDWHYTRKLLNPEAVLSFGDEHYKISHYDTVHHIPNANSLFTTNGFETAVSKIKEMLK